MQEYLLDRLCLRRGDALGFEYMNAEEVDRITFYRVPKVLFTDQRFEHLSTDAKLVYGMLLDRSTLSRENGWIDEEGRVYIKFSLKSLQEAMKISEKSATKYFQELENIGIIDRFKQGQGKPAIIYVKTYKPPQNLLVKDRNNYGSRTEEVTGLEPKKLPSNNINYNNTEFNNTNLILSEDEDRMGYELYLQDQLDLSALKQDYPYDGEMIDGIVDLLLDVLCSKRKTIQIAGDEKSVNVVKGRFMKLNIEHIRYVMDCLKNNDTKVRNIKQYILAALYNAPSTIDSYYRAEVNHDMATGKI